MLQILSHPYLALDVAECQIRYDVFGLLYLSFRASQVYNI